MCESHKLKQSIKSYTQRRYKQADLESEIRLIAIDTIAREEAADILGFDQLQVGRNAAKE